MFAIGKVLQDVIYHNKTQGKKQTPKKIAMYCLLKGCITSVKEIQIILRLFLVIAEYCQARSSQIKLIT